MNDFKSYLLITSAPIDLPDGVYINLPDHIYFQLDALGSTDLVTLFQKGAGWWWKSRHNPAYRRSSSQPLRFGSALHALVLEGGRQFEERFAVEPDPRDFPDLLRSADDIKGRLAEMGLKAPSKLTKPELVEYIMQHAPHANVWDDIIARFKARLVPADDQTPARQSVSAEDNAALRIMADMLLDDPDVAPLFEHNADSLPLAEVTVIYTTPEGVRRRARLDLLTPPTICDLKTIDVWDGKPLQFAVPERIARAGYDIQRADYDDARAEAHIAIMEGRVFGATADELAWLRRFPSEAPNWNWLWLFYQKPDAQAGQAPVLFPLEDQAESLYHVRGRAKKAVALRTYLACLAEFGLDRPWRTKARLHFTDRETAEAYKEPGKPVAVVHAPKWYRDEEIEG